MGNGVWQTSVLNRGKLGSPHPFVPTCLLASLISLLLPMTGTWYVRLKSSLSGSSVLLGQLSG